MVSRSAMKTGTGSLPFEHMWVPARAGGRMRGDLVQLIVILLEHDDHLPDRTALADLFQSPKHSVLFIRVPRRPASNLRAISSCRAQLVSLLDHLALLGWDPRDVFLVGHGACATIINDFALNYARPLAGVVTSGGRVHFFPDWKKTLPASAFHTPRLVTHGYFDEEVAPSEIHDAVAQWQAVGLPVVYREFNKERGWDEERELPFVARWLKSKGISGARRRFPRPVLHRPVDLQMSSSNS